MTGGRDPDDLIVADGDLVLRPLEVADLVRLAAWINDPVASGAYDEVGHTTPAELARRWIDEAEPQSRGQRIIELDGKAIGNATWTRHPMDDWVGWFGLTIALPSLRGQGLGTRVHRLGADWLFSAHADLHKLEAVTDVDNRAERRALDKAGFTFEGVLRRRNRLRGEWRDMAFYGLLREEWGA